MSTVRVAQRVWSLNLPKTGRKRAQRSCRYASNGLAKNQKKRHDSHVRFNLITLAAVSNTEFTATNTAQKLKKPDAV